MAQSSCGPICLNLCSNCQSSCAAGRLCPWILILWDDHAAWSRALDDAGGWQQGTFDASTCKLVSNHEEQPALLSASDKTLHPYRADFVEKVSCGSLATESNSRTIGSPLRAPNLLCHSARTLALRQVLPFISSFKKIIFFTRKQKLTTIQYDCLK